MAHIPASTAIFSPSVARLAASASRDWNYVDSWLSSKFHGRTPPPFERNPETLKALLALAAVNETADEERDLVARVEATALNELRRTHDAPHAEEGAETNVRDHLLDAVEHGLSRDATAALDAMAAAAVAAGIACPDPEALGRSMLDLQGQIFHLEQTADRIAALQRCIDTEAAKTQALLAGLDEDGYRPAPHLAKQNLELQRRIKATAAKLPETKQKAASMAHSATSDGPTIEQVKKDEGDYLRLLAQKKNLEIQTRSFQGLPPDTNLARQECEKLRVELQAITRQRDAVFEGLVERETPRKRP